MTRTAGCSPRKLSKDSSVRWKTGEFVSDQGTSGVFGCVGWGLKWESRERKGSLRREHFLQTHYRAEIKHSCSPHSTQCHTSTHHDQNSLTLVDRAQCCLWPNKRTRIQTSSHSLEKYTWALLDEIFCYSSAAIAAVLSWTASTQPHKSGHNPSIHCREPIGPPKILTHFLPLSVHFFRL